MKKNKLKVSILCLLLGVIFQSVCAQEKAALYGTWVLDKALVNEVVQGKILEKTIYPNEQSKLDPTWMMEFSLNADGTASFVNIYGKTYILRCGLQEVSGNYTLILYDMTTDEISYNVTFLEDNKLQLTHIGNGSKLYYHK